jgi:hypothetical protein
VRYRACDGALAAKSGTLGQVSLAKDFDLGSHGIAAGTMKIITSFCTPSSPPYSKWKSQRAAKPHADNALLAHIKRKAELLDTDAAADEQRAQTILRVAELPNLKIHNLDKAHSSRRTATCLAHAVATTRRVVAATACRF